MPAGTELGLWPLALLLQCQSPPPPCPRIHPGTGGGRSGPQRGTKTAWKRPPQHTLGPLPTYRRPREGPLATAAPTRPQGGPPATSTLSQGAAGPPPRGPLACGWGRTRFPVGQAAKPVREPQVPGHRTIGTRGGGVSLQPASNAKSRRLSGRTTGVRAGPQSGRRAAESPPSCQERGCPGTAARPPPGHCRQPSPRSSPPSTQCRSTSARGRRAEETLPRAPEGALQATAEAPLLLLLLRRAPAEDCKSITTAKI